MHDIRAIRDNPEAFDAAMARRGISGSSITILNFDDKRRALVADLQRPTGWWALRPG